MEMGSDLLHFSSEGSPQKVGTSMNIPTKQLK